MNNEELDNKVSDMFQEDIDNFIKHVNLLITAHNKQLDKIEKLENALIEINSCCYKNNLNVMEILEIINKALDN